jgi:hypothetical protein
MQKLKPRHCGDGDSPPEQDKEEPGRDTKGRRIKEESEAEDKDVIQEDENQNATPDEQPQQETQVQDKEEEDRGNKEQQDTESEHTERETTESEDEKDQKNTKRYNLRKRKGRTVYVSASKIFRLDNLRDTDDVIEAMKREYKVSIGGSFFAGRGGSAKMGKQDGRGNQQDDPYTDDDKGKLQPEQDIEDTQPQQQKPPRMLTNLARYNAPGIKDKKNVSGKRNQRNKHQMAAECDKKRDRIAKSDMLNREKQQRMMENIRAEILAGQQGSTTSSTTTLTLSQTTSQASSRSTSPSTSRETSPSTTRKISRRERVDKNLQDISARMQQTGQVLTAAGLALFKSMKPDKKYW